MSKNNIIFCDGGLANRLNSLISGLKFSEITGGDWSICWPVNEWCGSPLENLFDINLPIINNNLEFYRIKNKDLFYIMHEDQLGFNPLMYVNVNGISNFECLNLNSSLPYFYYNNLIPNFINLHNVAESLKKIKLNDEIKNNVEEFIIKNQIDENTIGLHIRKTDFGNVVDDEKLFELVLGNESKFFVCTDDMAVSKKFSKLRNCILYKHNNYVEKRDTNLDWNGKVTDNVGRNYNFNVNRNSDSVKGALIDMAILSKTKIVNTSHSTFLKMAILFKQTQYI